MDKHFEKSKFATKKENNMLKIDKTHFGKILNPLTTKPVDVHCYTMTNSQNLSISILTRGATIHSIKYPDKYGKIDDVCLGFDDVESYTFYKTYYIGATVGRVANRVAEGKYRMACKDYKLNKNFQDKYHYNGGFIGFDLMVWTVIAVNPNGIVMQHVSPHRFECYPGELTTTIAFNLDQDNNFEILIEAKTTRITPVNITNYLFLNLAGHNAQKEGLYQHNVMIKSNSIVECDTEQLPNGCIMPVKKTLYDFRKYVFLGKRLKKLFSRPLKGYDNNFCTEVRKGKMTPVSKVIHPCSGRWVEISTNQYNVHFFTCNNWPDPIETDEKPIYGKGKATYTKYAAFCMATQNYPDAMNHQHFPSVFLNPDQKYCHRVIYRFGCSDKNL